MNPLTASLLRQCVDGGALFNRVEGCRLAGDQPWSGFGIRDPSILSHPDGDPVVDGAGRLTLYFNARDREINQGGITSVGLAHGSQLAGWSIRPKPVLFDGAYAAQGSVLRLAADHFRMYYSPDTLQGFALASSTDGLVWQRFGHDLILTPRPFGALRMGLPFVRRIRDQWVMVFEGTDAGRFHIYLATSPDGINWQAGNQGRPIHTPAAGAWDCFGQANPSLYVAKDHDGDLLSYFILYNGCREAHAWDIGALCSDTLEGPWRVSPAPVLRRGQIGEWDAGRIEGARLLDLPGRPPSIVYFGLPTVDSYAGGRIAFAAIEVNADASSAGGTTSDGNAAAERTYNDLLALRYFDVWDNFPIQRFTTGVESQLLADVLAPSSQVILLGSGGGRELPVLLDKACQVTAVDISPQMLAVGRRRYPDAEVTWIEADLHALPNHLVDFDAAVCLGAVFNYLRNPELFLVNARRCLKRNGALILAVINSGHPSEMKGRIDLPDGRVQRIYSVTNLEALLGSTGFEIVSIRGVRFLVDLLPAEWNSQAAQQPLGSGILNRMLVDESKLSECMPPEKAKFILIHALARSADAQGFSGDRPCS